MQLPNSTPYTFPIGLHDNIIFRPILHHSAILQDVARCVYSIYTRLQTEVVINHENNLPCVACHLLGLVGTILSSWLQPGPAASNWLGCVQYQCSSNKQNGRPTHSETHAPPVR